MQKVCYEKQSMYVKYLKHFALVFERGQQSVLFKKKKMQNLVCKICHVE